MHIFSVTVSVSGHYEYPSARHVVNAYCHMLAASSLEDTGHERLNAIDVFDVTQCSPISTLAQSRNFGKHHRLTVDLGERAVTLLKFDSNFSMIYVPASTNSANG